eukprot:2780143-Ditylum_brightwellii.AAC.1
MDGFEHCWVVAAGVPNILACVIGLSIDGEGECPYFSSELEEGSSKSGCQPSSGHFLARGLVHS